MHWLLSCSGNPSAALQQGLSMQGTKDNFKYFAAMPLFQGAWMSGAFGNAWQPPHAANVPVAVMAAPVQSNFSPSVPALGWSLAGWFGLGKEIDNALSGKAASVPGAGNKLKRPAWSMSITGDIDWT